MIRIVVLLLKLICYVALGLLLAGAAALAVVWLSGQCPAPSEIGVTCTTRFSESLAGFGLAVWVPTLEMGFPIVLAVSGLIFLMRDLRRRARS